MSHHMKSFTNPVKATLIIPSGAVRLHLPPVACIALKRVLIPKVLLAAVALLYFSHALIFALSIGRQGVSPKYIDPFAAYIGILPGQPIEALAVHQCSPFYIETDYLIRNIEAVTCEIYPLTGAVPLITVISLDGVINQLTFKVDGLQVADVVQRWGPPDLVHKSKRFYAAHWNEGVFVRVGLSDGFSYHAPVEEIVLT